MPEIILLSACLANTVSHASPVMFSSDCGEHWWLDDDGRPKQNLHCGQLFPDPSSTTPTTTMSAATSSSPSSTSDLSQPCTDYEFLCGDGYTCLSLSKLCDGVSICFERKWEHDRNKSIHVRWQITTFFFLQISPTSTTITRWRTALCPKQATEARTKKCVKHLPLESMIVSSIHEDSRKMWRSTKSILTLYCGIQLKSFQYTTVYIVIFCE